MHYCWILDIQLSATYHLEVYYIAYKTLGHTHPVIVIAEEKGGYSPSKKLVELERNLSLTLLIINPEK